MKTAINWAYIDQWLNSFSGWKKKKSTNTEISAAAAAEKDNNEKKMRSRSRSTGLYRKSKEYKRIKIRRVNAKKICAKGNIFSVIFFPLLTYLFSFQSLIFFLLLAHHIQTHSFRDSMYYECTCRGNKMKRLTRKDKKRLQ